MFTVLLYYCYGTEMVLKAQNNRVLIVSICHVMPSILPKCAKTREPEDEHCVLQCT